MADDAPLTLRALNRATLARQMLLAREALVPAAAVERLVGLQAQWPRPPFVGLWTRLAGFKGAALAVALARRQIVRATMMRGTLHLVSARDYTAFRATLQPMLTAAMLAILRNRAKGLDVGAVVAAARAFFAEAPRTFEEVRDVLTARYPKVDERAMGFAVRMTLPLVQVPTETTWGYPTVASFTLADEWLGGAPRAGDARAALVTRYLAAFGPATVTDAQTWSGLPALREVFETLRPKLRVFRDERRRELFDLPRAPRPAEETAAPPRFLPEFDNLLLGHHDRRRVVGEAHRRQVFLPGLRVAPTFLVDGVVAGTWAVERKKTAATLVVHPFAPLSKTVRAQLDEEATALVRFTDPDAASHAVRVA